MPPVIWQHQTLFTSKMRSISSVCLRWVYFWKLTIKSSLHKFSHHILSFFHCVRVCAVILFDVTFFRIFDWRLGLFIFNNIYWHRPKSINSIYSHLFKLNQAIPSISTISGLNSFYAFWNICKDWPEWATMIRLLYNSTFFIWNQSNSAFTHLNRDSWAVI